MGELYEGTVTRVDGPVCYVEVPGVAKGSVYGPARYPAQLAATGAGGADGHTHALRQLAKGDRVAVGFLSTGQDAIVVLARLT